MYFPAHSWGPSPMFALQEELIVGFSLGIIYGGEFAFE